MKGAFLVCLLFLIIHGFSQSGQLTVEIRGVNSGEGQLKLGIFNKEEDYRSRLHPVYSKTVAASDSIVLCYFKDLPTDSYAAAVYHDTNNDDELNTKKLGIPTEGVGFSGTTLKSLRPPKYDEAIFKFSEDTTIYIYLKYPNKSSH